MAYNSGVSSLFSQTASATAIIADSIEPTFSFTGSIDSLFGVFIEPSLRMQSSGVITNFYGQQVTPNINFTSGLISTVTGVNISGPNAVFGAMTNAYSLYVNPFSGSASAINNFTAYFEGSVGIGTTTPQSYLDVRGSMAIGTYAGAISASVSQLIITGSLGIGKTSPSYAVDVTGVAAATRILSPQTTQRYQLSYLSEAFYSSQGGGCSGTKIFLNASSCETFDLQANVSSAAARFRSASYDGRYVYMAPFNATLFVRYDSFLPLTSSSSYESMDLTLVNSLFAGSAGLGFDGQYIYLTGITAPFIRYDVGLPFTSSASYSSFNITLVNSNGVGFGITFDGKYLYMSNGSGGNFIRYDTTLPFNSASSYQTFIPPNAIGDIPGFIGYQGGTFDGRYVYLTPQVNVTGPVSAVVRYDTLLSFTASSSYSVFNTVTISGAESALAFQGAIFTGRYVYFVPFSAGGVPAGQIVQYDTTSSFTSTNSYQIFNVNSFGLGAGYIGGTFDGRYVYFVPVIGTIGRMTRYDTLLPFTASTSYSTLVLTTLNSRCQSFQGVTFDGRYVYFLPDEFGVGVRINAYAAAQGTYLNALAAPQGLTFLNQGGLSLTNASTSGTATGGVASAVPTQASGYLIVTINGTQRKIVVYGN